jgi:hypothetical protein
MYFNTFDSLFYGVLSYRPMLLYIFMFNANSTFFQLYHGEKSLISNEMMMKSALY